MMGDPMEMQEMMEPMAHVMLYTPQHLLPRKDALGLTADQVARLTALRDATTAAQDAAMTEARTHLEELQTAAEAASPDTAAVKTHFQAAHVAMGRARWLAIRSALEARALLSDPQRTKLKAWADSMQAWMEQHRQMMKPSPSH
jgi:Spy/CpxP family protein refolding chaperone